MPDISKPRPGARMLVTQDSGHSWPTHRSDSTEVTIRDSHGPGPAQDVVRRIVAEDTVNLPACHHCPEQDVSDPLRMASESSADDTPLGADSSVSDQSSSSGGLSQLLSRILDQLSISAWLPAAMLVGNAAVLFQLRSNRSLNIADAVKDLAGKPLGTLIVLAFSLLLTTIITQAFEFEVIRFLEGYFNSTHRLVQAGLTLRIRRHEAKRKKLQDERQQAERNAFMQAREVMLSKPGAYDRAALDLIEDGIYQRPPRKVTRAVQKIVNQIDWRKHLPPQTLYQMESIQARLESYPVSNHILPTRLGNALRAFEDRLPLAQGEDLEGFVIRHYDVLPPTLKAEHRDHRTRLDMYCCLVLVFAALAMLGFGLLIGVVPPWGVALITAAYCVMSYVCYEAAIATTRGYGVVLVEIGQRIAAKVDMEQDD
jgi:hypothetical protein